MHPNRHFEMTTETQTGINVVDQPTLQFNLTDNAEKILKTFSEEKLRLWAKSNNRPEHYYEEFEIKMAVAMSGVIWARSIRRRWAFALWTLVAILAIAAYTISPNVHIRWCDSFALGTYAVICMLIELFLSPGSERVRHQTQRLKEKREAYIKAAKEFAESIKPLLSADNKSVRILTTADMRAKIEETVRLELTAQQTLTMSPYPTVDAVRLRERADRVIELNTLSNHLWSLNHGLDYGVENRQGLTEKVKNQMK
jgi:hypothetical protein